MKKNAYCARITLTIDSLHSKGQEENTGFAIETGFVATVCHPVCQGPWSSSALAFICLDSQGN